MTQTVTVEELEKRMRPGQWSTGGFIGLTESLEQVISQDAKTLTLLGVTYEQIADLLTTLLVPALNHTRGRSLYPDLYHPETIPNFSQDNMPDMTEGYLADDLQIFTIACRGIQDCPWGCEQFTDLVGYADFLMINRRKGEFVTGPSLIIHLIREHHFFEGVESPYRTDPAKLISVLGLDSRGKILRK